MLGQICKRIRELELLPRNKLWATRLCAHGGSGVWPGGSWRFLSFRNFRAPARRANRSRNDLASCAIVKSRRLDVSWEAGRKIPLGRAWLSVREVGVNCGGRCVLEASRKNGSYLAFEFFVWVFATLARYSRKIDKLAPSARYP